MKVSVTLFISALAAIANAVQFTVNNWDVVAGQPFTITWTGADGDVTILLKNGKSGDLKTVQTLTTSGTGGSFTWTPPSSLPSDTYALEITDASGVPNYGSQFSFVGSGTASATTSTASSTSTSASSSTTSSASTTSAHTITTSAANSTTTTSSTRTPISNSTTLTTSTSSASTSGSSTGSSSSSSASATSTRVPNTNNGHRVASSLALILGAVAAFAAFN